MVTRPSIGEVETVYNGHPVDDGELDSSGDFDSPDDAERLIESAVSMLENLYQDQLLFTSEIADEDEAVKYLSAHKWALALGQTQSESQAGANVTYNVPQQVARSLKRTEYGLEFLEYVHTERNVSIFKT